jgi:hypothetical protein
MPRRRTGLFFFMDKPGSNNRLRAAIVNPAIEPSAEA